MDNHIDEEYGYDRKWFLKLADVVLKKRHAGEKIHIADLVRPSDYVRAKFLPMGSTPPLMVKKEIEYLVRKKKIPMIGNRVLDVGMGPGHLTHYLREKGVEVIGFEADPDVFEYERVEGKTFFTPVEEMPADLFHTFDVALQLRAQDLSKIGSEAGVSPLSFKSSVAAVSRALKKEGVFVGTVIDSQITFKNGQPFFTPDGHKIINALEANFEKVQIEPALHGPKDRSALWIAYVPKK